MLEVIFQLSAPLAKSEPSREFIQVIDGEIRDRDSDDIVGRISRLRSFRSGALLTPARICST